MSSEVNSPNPLWNSTPFLSLNVQDLRSLEASQLSARSGSSCSGSTPPGAGRTNPLKIVSSTVLSEELGPAMGSSLLASLELRP